MSKVKVIQKVTNKEQYISIPRSVINLRGKIRDTSILAYGLFLYRYNLTANNILNFYDYYLDFPYITCTKKQIQKYLNINPKNTKAITNIFKDLESVGLIERKHRTHRWEIRLPKVEKKLILSKKVCKLINNKVKDKLGVNSTFIQGVNSTPIQSVKSTSMQGVKSTPIYNNKNSNNKNSNNKNCNVVVSSLNKKPHKQQQKQPTSNSRNSSEVKLPKWIIKHLNRSIGELVYKHCHNNMSKTKDYCTSINDVIFHTNNSYSNIRGTKYWEGNTNPYVQKQLLKDLKNIFDKNLDLQDTIKTKYNDYINDNTDLQLKDSDKNKQRKKDQKLYKNWNNGTYIMNLEADGDTCRETGSKEDKDSLDQMIHLAKKYSSLTDKQIKEAYGLKLHPTDKKTQAKIHKQLRTLKRHDNKDYINNNVPNDVTKARFQDNNNHITREQKDNEIYTDFDTGKRYKYIQLKQNPSLAPTLSKQLGLVTE